MYPVYLEAPVMFSHPPPLLFHFSITHQWCFAWEFSCLRSEYPMKHISSAEVAKPASRTNRYALRYAGPPTTPNPTSPTLSDHSLASYDINNKNSINSSYKLTTSHSFQVLYLYIYVYHCLSVFCIRANRSWSWYVYGNVPILVGGQNTTLFV